MSIGMMLISVELLIMLFILLFIPGDYAGPCFIGFAIGESLGAAALRIAGGIFTKIADIGADLMKIVFKIKEDDARNPGVIADCTGDNAGDSVGPVGRWFRDLWRDRRRADHLHFAGREDPDGPGAVAGLDFRDAHHDAGLERAGLFHQWRHRQSPLRQRRQKMNFETPLTSLVWLTSIVSIIATYFVSYFIIPEPRRRHRSTQWWKLASIISCGTLAGALIPELVKAFTSVESRHVNEVVTSAKEGGASLGILSGLVAGNFSAYWLGLAMVGSDVVAYFFSGMGLAAAATMIAAPVFAFGLVAFGFLGMGPVTIAVDSYGPVTDNAQSVYELSMIEQVPNIKAKSRKTSTST
jgi:K(+)-stimulated pyrophosphate-energized sodium pump